MSLPHTPDARAFKVDTIAWNGHELTSMPIESEYKHKDNPDVRPPDWEEVVSEHLDHADMLVLPYFIPELERNLFCVPIAGHIARSYAYYSMDVYDRAAEIAAEKGKQVAIADPANKLSYSFHEWRPMNIVATALHVGTHNVETTKWEKVVPTTTDGRRVFTAAAILQLAERYSEGGKFLYLAAAAHVNRVQDYVQQGHSEKFHKLFRRHKRSLLGADKNIRLYEYSGSEWVLTEKQPLELAAPRD